MGEHSGAGADEIRVFDAGDLACLIEAASLPAVLRIADSLRALADPDLIDIVPAARTVLVRCTDRAAVRRVAALVRERARAWVAVPRPPGCSGTGREVVIDVVYDGDDLAAVAELTGLSIAGVVRAHGETPWQAAFGGFAPGFVYLTGGDPRLTVPRLDAPRTRVPAGSVALAGEFSAVYPSDSPGGWQLIGRTDEPLWDLAREAPALIRPGDTVRFRPEREQVAAASGERDTRRSGPRDISTDAAATIVSPGMLALVQDQGRPGCAEIGVTASGALDRDALRRANAAVGNDAGAAGIELLGGGFALRAERDLVVAVTDAGADVRVQTLATGATLRFGLPCAGLRAYLALRGGFDAEPVLESRSRDTLSGLGPQALAAGDVVAVGETPSVAVPDEARDAAGTSAGRPVLAGGAVFRYVSGPREDWFTDDAQTAFALTAWEVSPQSNRVGVRLAGEPLERARTGELASEGMTRGSVQVPPDGKPVLFLADHPVTGGYPVIGTVIDADLDQAAQLAPGDTVRFVPVDPDRPGDPIPFGDLQAHARVPEIVRFTVEIDGQRHPVTVPGWFAAALDHARDSGRNEIAVDAWAAILRERVSQRGAHGLGRDR